MSAEEEVVERAESTYEFSCDDDTDTISLTDTVKTEYDTDIFQLDCILAEAKDEDDDEKMMYLVKWSGWSIYSSTWQSAEDFTGDAARTLWEWQEERMRRTRGHKEEFEIDRWQDDMDRIAQARYERHHKRNKRRKKLGQPEVEYDGEAEDSDDADDDGDAEMQEASTSLSSKRGTRAEMVSQSSDSDDDIPIVRRRKSVPSEKDVAKASSSSSTKPKRRGPFEDDSNDEDSLFVRTTPVPRASKTSTTPSSADSKPTRKRRTDAEIQREKEHTRELQKRKKGTAVPVDKSTKSAPTKASTSTVAQPKRTEVKAKPQASSYFQNLTQQRKPSTTTTQTNMPPPPLGQAPVAKMAKMVRSGKTTTKPKSAPAAAKRPATNIFNTSAPASRTRRPASPTRLKNLSHMHHTLKRQRNELAPDITKLNLYELGSAKPSSPPQQRAPSTIARPETREQAASDEDEDFGKAEREEQAAFDSMTAAARVVEQDKQPQVPLAAAKQLSLREEQVHSRDQPWNGFYTCFHWYNKGFCHHRDNCTFEHHVTGRVAPADNWIDAQDVTCLYWYNGGCFRPARDCKFAHCETRYLAQGGGHPVRLNPDNMNNVRTCYYWFFGNPACNKTDCEYAHARRRFIQPGPSASRTEKTKGIPYAEALNERLAQNELVAPEKLGVFGQQTRASQTQEIVDTPDDDMILQTERTPSPPPRAPRDGTAATSAPLTFTFQRLQQGATTTAQSQVTMGPDPSTKSIPVRLCTATDAAQSTVEGSLALDIVLRCQDRETYDRMFSITARGDNGDTPRMLTIQSICIAEIFGKYHDPQTTTIAASGDVQAAAGTQAAFDLFVDTLICHSSGAVIQDDKFSMIIFPTQPRTWDFLRLKRSELGTGLQFVVMPPFSSMPTEEINDLSSDLPMQDLSISSKLKIDADRLFSSSSSKGVFIVLHPDYAGDCDLLVSALHELEATVYLSSTAGAWLYFTSKHQVGSVIFHHTFDDFHRVPDLANILRNGRYKFFSFHINRTTLPPSLGLPRLFPQGRAVLIMDSAWSDFPSDTFSVLRWLESAIDRSPGLYRILGRPNLLSWLEELALADNDEARYNIYNMLHTILHASPGYTTKFPFPHPGFPTADSPVYYEHLSSFPGYEEISAANSLDAEDLLAAWFSTWALQHVYDFRNFIIVKAGSSPRIKAWAELYKHIEVQSPTQYVEAERKRKEEKDKQREKERKEEDRRRARAKEKEKERTATKK